jgi:hypothetical protein
MNPIMTKAMQRTTTAGTTIVAVEAELSTGI